MQINPSKSTGTDNIPARFVKDAASVFKKPIERIINLSIEKNIVPKDLKNSRGVPLFKKIREARSVTKDLSVCCLLYQKSWKGLFIHNWEITL